MKAPPLTRATRVPSGNYWAQISDPGLSASWLTHHSQTFPCTLSRNPTRDGSCRRVNSNRYTCGAWSCDRNSGSWRCRAASQQAAWDSEVKFTGFAPEAMKVGPEIQDLAQSVQDERAAKGL